MRSYHVDGNALVLLDDEDFANLGITSRLHIKKIRVEVERLFDKQKQRKVRMSADHEVRREKIRKQKMFHTAAVKIQAQFRRYAAQKELAMLREMQRLRVLEDFRQMRIQEGATWWSDKASLPSKKLAVLPSIGSNGVKLPPIKAFGRNRDHQSHRGWARKTETLLVYASVSDVGNSNSEYQRYLFKNQLSGSGDLLSRPGLAGSGRWVATAAAVLDPLFQGEDSPSLIFSEKLFRSGYDEKRLQRFKQSQV